MTFGLRIAITAMAVVVMTAWPCRAADESADIAAGREIFMRKCQGCHRLTDGVKVGPGLLGVTRRRTDDWLHAWLESPKAMIAKGDPAALELKKRFGVTMRTMKAMKDPANRRQVIAFLKENDQAALGEPAKEN